MRAAYIEDVQQWMNEFEFFVKVQVRFSETDMYGHLNNTVPFTYFEYARIEFFKSIGLMNDWSDKGKDTIPVVADLQCDYLKQVYFDEELQIYVKIASVGTSSIDIHYIAKNDKNQPVFTGRGAIVQISRNSGKSVPWTTHENQLLHGK